MLLNINYYNSYNIYYLIKLIYRLLKIQYEINNNEN